MQVPFTFVLMSEWNCNWNVTGLYLELQLELNSKGFVASAELSSRGPRNGIVASVSQQGCRGKAVYGSKGIVRRVS